MEPRNQRRGGLGWFGQAVSGVLLLILLGLHMIAHHFVVEGGLRTYQDVLNYIRQPLVATVELIFLVVVSFHAMLGLRAVLFDLGLNTVQEKWVTRGVTILGMVMVAYGIWLTITLVSQV
ncbi:MAG: hypothetical protein JXB30_19610 [Anaerolineae bacterium]|nr:hypothetical protein [Anaerolineae bacterium]